jgi:hypothetical protein
MCSHIRKACTIIVKSFVKAIFLFTFIIHFGIHSLFVSEERFSLTRGRSTVADQSPRYLEVKGSSPIATGTGGCQGSLTVWEGSVQLTSFY